MLNPTSSRIETWAPGASIVPDADADMLRTCKFSMHTIAWFWLIVVVFVLSHTGRNNQLFPPLNARNGGWISNG